MNQIRLSDRELVYLAAQAGAMRFYGIPDPFFAMDAAQLRFAVEEVKRSLHNKGYADQGFDSGFSISEDVLSLMEVCALCERYLITSLSGTDSDFRTVAYSRDSRVVILQETGKGDYLLTEVYDQTLTSSLEKMDLFFGHTVPTQEAISVSIPFQTLASAQKKAVPEEDDAGALTVLMEGGVPEPMAKVLLAGFHGTAPSLNMNLIDLQRRRTDGFLCFAAQEGMIRMSPIWLDEEESWQIAYTTSCELAEEARGLMLACSNPSPSALP